MLGLMTAATCGDACWHAREDICRCSCGGKNHGCLRDANGVKPVRTARIDGVMRRLAGVGNGVGEEAQRLNMLANEHYKYAADCRDRCFARIPARIRCATRAQIAKWPELTAYRELKPWERRPYLLWIKVE